MQNRLKLVASATDPRTLFVGRQTAAFIKDRTATLMLFEDKLFVGLQAFTGNVTIPVELCIRDTADSLQAGNTVGRDIMPDFIFDPVVFENGIAYIQWSEPFIPGVITVTGIPAQYNDLTARIGIGLSDLNLSNHHHVSTGGGIVPGGYMSNNIFVASGNIDQGRVTTKIYKETSDKYMTYNFTGTRDIIISIPNGRNPTFITVGINQALDYFLFRNVQITNGRVTINFNQGTKL